MAFESRPLTTQSLARQIAEQIRQAIIEGRLGANDRLPGEEQLAEQYGVSRPTVREALKRLAAQHLIRSQRGPSGGTFVNRPNHEQLRESLTGAAMVAMSLGEFDTVQIGQARRELEGLCCRLAVDNRTQEHLDTMAAEIVKQHDDGLSDEDFCASDVRFHRALVDATGNRVLQFLMFAVIEAVQPVVNMAVYRYRERTHIVRQHERIYRALKDKNAESASAALDEQMAYLEERLSAARARS